MNLLTFLKTNRLFAESTVQVIGLSTFVFIIPFYKLQSSVLVDRAAYGKFASHPTTTII